MHPMTPRVRRWLIPAMLLPLLLIAAVTSAPAREPYRNGGVARLAQTLRRLSSGVRVLHVAAHPDDEDSALIAKLSLGDGARVTYLSLSRGEGGQNLIGPEFFADLGVLRSSELLAARRLDGGRQLFGREIDFGYSKTAAETLTHWPREQVVKDIVRAIRRTRPHIVFCRFSGTPLDGHGQHQVSVIATRLAIEAAGDSRRFPELIEQGLAPWRVQKFYTGILAANVPGALQIATDVYDPWVGRSLGSIGYAGRSMHRSQDMGMIEFEASRPSVLLRERPKSDPTDPEEEFFEGLQVGQTRLRSRAGELLLRARALNDPMVLARDLATLLQDWRGEAPEDLEAIEDLEDVLAAALGLRVEAISDAASLHPGGGVGVTCQAYVPGAAAIRNPRWELMTREGLSAREAEAEQPAPLQAVFRLEAPADARPALPYYLREDREGDLYRWPDTEWAGDPFEAPLATAVFTAGFEGTEFSIETPVEYRYADPAFGEIREDLVVLPPVSISFDPPAVRLASNQALVNRSIVLVAENRSSTAFEGRLVLHDPEGGDQSPIALDIALEPGKLQRFPIILEDNIFAGRNRRELTAQWQQKRGVDLPAYSISKLDYRHIRTRTLCRPVRLELQRLNVVLPEKLKVGYVLGPSDTVGEILAELGAEVVYLTPDDLAKRDFSDLDAIVTGSRAYEVRSDLAENNARLLNYVRAGGTLIVQYNKYPYVELGVAPLPVAMAHPHDRVTDENAKVELLRPEHPVFLYPNPIQPADFEGWIQERGLYFASTWDPAYVPLIAAADPGEKPKAGGMLWLKLGSGNYVYTGYAFFRQLPEGVEGATRLFANLVSLGRAPGGPRRQP